VSVEQRNARDASRWLRLARRGDFAAAWRVSDAIRARCRTFNDAMQPRHLQQIWDGRCLEGGHVLVRCYHGLGDTIQFARFLAPLRLQARCVTVWAQPSLVPLLSTLHVPIALEPLHDGVPSVAYDADIEIMELPYAFRTTLESLPADVPYLHVPPAPCPPGRLPRVGIVWRAGDWDSRRSIPFERLAPLFGITSVEWYGLQLAPTPHERHASLQPLTADPPLRLASCMRALDLVISVDTMAAHLAGALGVPVWLLLAHDADWRWLEQRHDSPWYPTMRIFRQPEPGRWCAVIAEVVRTLALGG
jgi:hypothetical protein